MRNSGCRHQKNKMVFLTKIDFNKSSNVIHTILIYLGVQAHSFFQKNYINFLMSNDVYLFYFHICYVIKINFGKAAEHKITKKNRCSPHSGLIQCHFYVMRCANAKLLHICNSYEGNHGFEFLDLSSCVLIDDVPIR